MKEVKKMSAQTREMLLRASAQRLPDRPTAAGMKPDDIRRTLWVPMLGEELSLATEQDRIVEETNAALAELAEQAGVDTGGLEAAITSERQARERALSELQAALSALIEKEDARASAHDEEEENYRAQAEEETAAYREEVAAALSEKLDRQVLAEGERSVYAQSGEKTLLYSIEEQSAGRYSIAMRDISGRLFAKTPDDKLTTVADPKQQVVNIKYLDGRMETDVDPRLTALETAVAGRARSYVLPDMAALADALCGRWELGEKTYYADALLTGDNLLIIRQNVPDFWFEATTDRNRAADTYTYTDADGGEVTLSLRVFGYDNGGYQVGLLHVLESDYTVIEGYSKSASRAAEEAAASASEVREVLGSVGELDAALDAILDLQASLIGGAT